ncbi:MAG TPA: hypothetical protein VIU11_29085 [Nakamurella sp.]
MTWTKQVESGSPRMSVMTSVLSWNVASPTKVPGGVGPPGSPTTRPWPTPGGRAVHSGGTRRRGIVPVLLLG